MRIGDDFWDRIAGVTGNKHNFQSRQTQSQVFDQFIACHPRHNHITYHQIDLLLKVLDDLNGFFATGC